MSVEIKQSKIAKVIGLDRFAEFVLDQVTEAVIVYDVNGRAVFANSAAVLNLGRIPDHELPIVTFPERRQLRLSVPLSGETLREISANFVPATGEEIPMIVNMGPLLDAKGNIVGCVIVLVDIRERVKTHRALKASEEKLLQAQKMESIGLLAGGIAHDFNNILATIGLLVDNLLEAFPEGHTHYEIASQLRDCKDRGSALTQQLLAFCRKQHVDPKPLDMTQVIVDMLKLLSRLVGEDIELLTDLDQNLQPILCDRNQFEQIVMNLVINAKEAIESSGRIGLRTWNEGNKVSFSVDDNGCGIDDETKSRIFEPFFTTKPHGKGTGLGLSTIFGIVKQHHGEIVVTSSPGKGSSLSVSFPQWHGPLDRPKANQRQIQTADRSLKILLAEDDSMLRQVTAAFLRSKGHQIIEAENGVQALDLLNSITSKIDLLITDVVMPKMCGAELAGRVQKMHPGVCILFLSGYMDDTLEKYQIHPESVAYLSKPFSRASLMHAIRAALYGKTAFAPSL